MIVPVSSHWTVVMRLQGAVTLGGPCDLIASTSVAVANAANSSYTCQSSLSSVPATCSYDPIKGLLTITGTPGDIVTWTAWTLTPAP